VRRAVGPGARDAQRLAVAVAVAVAVAALRRSGGAAGQSRRSARRLIASMASARAW
jgi:hypothetical protein